MDSTHVVHVTILALERLWALGVKTREPRARWHHKGTKKGSQCWSWKYLNILLYGSGKRGGLPTRRDASGPVADWHRALNNLAPDLQICFRYNNFQ